MAGDSETRVFGQQAAMGETPFQNAKFGYSSRETSDHSVLWYIGVFIVIFCAGLCVFSSSTPTCEKPQGLSESVTSFISDTKAATGCMLKSIVNSADYNTSCPVAAQCNKKPASIAQPSVYGPYSSGQSSQGSQDMNLHDLIAHQADHHKSQKYEQQFGSGVHQAMSTASLQGYNSSQSCTTCHTQNPVAKGFQMGTTGSVIGPQTVFSIGDTYQMMTGSNNPDLTLASVDRLHQSVAKNGIISPF